MISFYLLDVCSDAVSPAVLSRHVAANSKILFAHRCRSGNDRGQVPQDHGSCHGISNAMRARRPGVLRLGAVLGYEQRWWSHLDNERANGTLSSLIR